jgi:hypothetical protein
MRTLIPLTLIITAILAQFWMLAPLSDCDLYTHIVVSRWLPARVTLTETELPIPALLWWMAGFLYAQVDAWFGLVGVKALHITLMIMTFVSLGLWYGLVMQRLQGRYPSPFAIGAGLITAYLVSATNSNARAQDFTYLCFSLLLLFAECSSTKPSERCTKMWHSLALLALLIVWQNLHATVLLALPIIGAYVVWRKIPWWYIALPPLASICSANGTHIFAYTSANVTISRDLLRISEWLPPWDPTVRGAMIPYWFFAAMLAAAALSPKGRRVRWDPITTTVSIIFCILTLSSARFGALWGFVSVPLFGEVLSTFWPGMLATRSITSLRTRTVWITAAFAFATLALNPSPLLPHDSPLPVFQKLKVAFPTARIFNYREYGGALEYVGYPGWKVYIDGRLLLFTPETWRRYESIAIAQDKMLVAEVIKSHDLFVLHPSYHQALIALLRTDPAVKLLTEERSVVVFTANTGATQIVESAG